MSERRASDRIIPLMSIDTHRRKAIAVLIVPKICAQSDQNEFFALSRFVPVSVCLFLFFFGVLGLTFFRFRLRNIGDSRADLFLGSGGVLYWFHARHAATAWSFGHIPWSEAPACAHCELTRAVAIRAIPFRMSGGDEYQLCRVLLLLVVAKRNSAFLGRERPEDLNVPMADFGFSGGQPL